MGKQVRLSDPEIELIKLVRTLGVNPQALAKKIMEEYCSTPDPSNPKASLDWRKLFNG